MNSNWRGVLVFLAAFFLTSLSLSAEEAVSTFSDGMYNLKNGADTNYTAGVMGNFWDDGARLECQVQSGRNNQKFLLTSLDDGHCTLQAVHSEKYICAEGDSEEGKGICLCQYSELTEDGKWILVPAGDDCYRLYADNGMCIGTETSEMAAGTLLQLKPYDSQDMTQVWQFVSTKKDENDPVIAAEQGAYVELPDGIYEFTSYLQPTAHWNLSADSPQLVLAGDRGDLDSRYCVQKERVTDNGEALYSIRPYNEWESVLQKNYMNYIELQEYEDNVGAQLWQFVYCGWGLFMIRCVDDGTCAHYKAEEGLSSGIVTAEYGSVDENSLKWFIHSDGSFIFGGYE